MKLADASTLAPPPKKKVAAAPTPAPPAPVVTQAPPPPPPPVEQPDMAVQTRMNSAPPAAPPPAPTRQPAPPDDRGGFTPAAVAPPPPVTQPTQPPQANVPAETYDPVQQAIIKSQAFHGQHDEPTYGNGAATEANVGQVAAGVVKTAPSPGSPGDRDAAAAAAGGGAKAGADPGAAAGAAGADSSGKTLGQMIAESLAANPNASKGGYEGVGTPDHPGPDGQASYGTTLPQDGSQGTGAPATDPSVTSPGKTFDWQADPQLAKARGDLLDALQKSKGATMQQKINALLAFGDPDMIKMLLGANSPYADAAKADQFSTVATLQHDYDKSVRDTDEADNKQGLFYSGKRTGIDLPELARQKQQSYHDESGKLQDALAALTQQDVGAENDYNTNVRGEEEAAFQRALDEALKYGGTGSTTPPPSGDGGGSSSSTSGTTTYTPPKAGTTVKKKVAAPKPAAAPLGVRPDDRAVGPMTGALGSNGGRAVPVKTRTVSATRYRGPH